MTNSKMTNSNSTAKLDAVTSSRRAFLIGAGAVGGFALGFHVPAVSAQKTAR